MHFYGWKKGLKTGMYYLRTRPAAQAIQFTVDQSVLKDAKIQQAAAATGRPTTTIGGPTVGGNDTGMLTPSSSVSAPPARSMAAAVPAKSEETSTSSPSVPASTPSDDLLDAIPLDALSLDDATRGKAESDPEFANALKKKYLRELEDAKLQCSLENKEACVMCSG